MPFIARRRAEIQVTEIAAKSVLNRVAGMPFGWSINPYQGCAHQCVFCYARATHAYRDLDGIDDWGARIYAKVNAPAVLRAELRRPGPPLGEVAIGTATDPYQPAEARYGITRGILGDLSQARVPMHLITRSGLVVRDLDVLSAYAARAPISVCVSLPTLDAGLARELEPTVAPPEKRLAVVRRLAAAGIRTGVAVAPIIPGLTDAPEMLTAVVRAAAAAGAHDIWHSALNLGEVTREAFFSYLDERQPALIARYRSMYRGKYPPTDYVRAIETRFAAARAGVPLAPPPLITADPLPAPLTLFG